MYFEYELNLLFSNIDGEKKIGGPWYTPGAAFREIILWNV